MVEVGICINMNPTAEDKTGVDMLELYRDAGFDYAELPGGALVFQPPDRRKELEKKILASGLPCPAMSTLVHPSVRVTGPEVDWKRVDAYIEDVFSLAARLGVTTAVFGSNVARNVPMHFPPEKAWRQLADLLRRLGDRAGKDGITVVIEHINRLEGNIIETFEEGVAMCRQVAHPHVRCLVDYYHLALGREDLDSIAVHGGLIRHAHYANVLARSIPTEERHEERGLRFFAELKRAGYEGRISVEGFAQNRDEFGPCAAFMRKTLA